MAASAEPSSSLSFTSSSNISNGSTGHNISNFSSFETAQSLEVISLIKLSSNLEQLLVGGSGNFSDADIIVEGIHVGVHRCILGARSKFFNDLFKQKKASFEKEGKPNYFMSDFLPFGKIGYEAFLTSLSYLYTGKLKPSPPEVSTCVDNVCAHDACKPAISFAIELMYASTIFKVPELVSVFQRRLLNFVGKALVEDVVPLLLVSFNCELGHLFSQCLDRIARSDLDSIFLEKELPHEVSENIRLLRVNSKREEEKVPLDPLKEKRIRRIHKALDSDDVELVKLLLTESGVTLDDAFALHYAAAYCDPKVFSEVLGLGFANVNLRDSRGYTVLHVAAIRKEPSIIVSLLTKGASASEITEDGQSAVSICRRLTRPKDYHAKTERGQETNKDRLCIDVLEREMWRNPMIVNASSSSPMVFNDLHMKLLYLENRVALARLLFPLEAKLAMEIAHADTTSEFAGLSAFKSFNGNLREVDLNETPNMRNKRLHARMEALLRTVELGRRYFPNCSDVLDKFMEDDLDELVSPENGTPDEEMARFMELKEDVQKAFHKDKAGSRLSGGLSSSSSSSSRKRLCKSKH